MKKTFKFILSAFILSSVTFSLGFAQQKKMAFVSTTISPPDVYPLPVIYPPIVKKELRKIQEIRQNKERAIIDSLRLITVDALEKLTGYEILFGKSLNTLPAFKNIKDYELPSDKNAELMKIASDEKSIFPFQKMKVAGFFKVKENYLPIVKKICQALDVDAIAFGNWQIEIFGYGQKAYDTWLKHNIYIIGKDRAIIFSFPYVSNSRETPFEEPEVLLKIYDIEDISLESLVETWTKPKYRKKMIKKGM